MNKFSLLISFLLLFVSVNLSAAVDNGVRIKNLGRIDGVRDNMLVGYGLVTGLAGTGDSRRSRSTLQSVSNLLEDLGVNVDADDVNSRNVAAVTVTATLPAFTRAGDKMDVNVSSMGDARSLLGGTLLLTPLYGPDKMIHALAQGQISVGGYKYELNGNVVQKNHPTSGTISEGATIESNLTTSVIKKGSHIHFVLFEPDYTTANRIVEMVNKQKDSNIAKPIDAGRVEIKLPTSDQSEVVQFIAELENIYVPPDQRSRIVVNEKTGTVVSGGDVTISKVDVSHGDIKLSIVTDFLVSQPNGVLVNPNSGISTAVVPQTRIGVKESQVKNVSLPEGTKVADLVSALNKIKTSTSDMISILQGIKRAGALHAELIIQ